MSLKLSGVTETLLIPLWARAVETQRTDPLIIDNRAVEMVQAIEYDFAKFNKTWLSQTGIAIRTLLFDQAVTRFITLHPQAVVINLGCGLDTRFSRVDNGTIVWYDLDLPEPINLRRQFFNETDRYHLLGQSVFEQSWLETVKHEQRPVLIIAEGLFMYFSEPEVKQLFHQLLGAFAGAEMLVEVLAPVAVKRTQHHDTVKTMNTSFKWSVARGESLYKLDPRLAVLAEWNFLDYQPQRWRWLRWLALIPGFKRYFMSKIIHIKFNNK